MKLGITMLRALVGVLMMGHGLQKLAGWFGGRGLEGTGKGFEMIGLRPGRQHAILGGGAETAAGAMMVTGFATPLAASMITGVMATAIRRVHLPNGVWAADGGYEYNAVLMASAFAITAEGPGPLSLDEAFGITRKGATWAWAELAAGLLAAGAIELRARRAGTEEEQQVLDLRDDKAPAESGPVMSTEQLVEQHPS